MSPLRLCICIFLFSMTDLYAVDFGAPTKAPDVLALAFEVNEPQGSHKIFCSAVLVHPQILLSAAHCFQDNNHRESTREQRARAKKIKVFLGHDSQEGYVSDELAAIDRFHIHPRYLRDIRGQADIAVVKLKEPLNHLKQYIRPFALEPELLKINAKRGNEVEIIGYGFSEQMQGRFGEVSESFGIKHSGILKIEGRTSSEVLVVAGQAVDRFGLYRPAPREGDSGGPLFIQSDNKSYLLGLVSRATRFNHGPQGTAFAIVRHWLCWIESVAGIKFRSEEGPDYCAARRSSASSSFQEMCVNGSQSELYTIEVLHRKYKTNSCLELESRLRLETNISLEASYLNDLSPLRFFTHFERLILRDNAITNLSALSGLSQLRTLDLSYNNIRDFSPLKDLGDVWIIGEKRQYNNIGRTEFIRQCLDPSVNGESRKTINYILHHFGLEQSDCVDGNYELIRRRDLSFEFAPELTDFSMLKNLHTLESLRFKGQRIQSTDFLASLSELRELRIDNASLGSPIRWLGLKNLNDLSVQFSGLKSLEFISDLKRLRSLDITGNSITDFGPLSSGIASGRLEVRGVEQQLLK